MATATEARPRVEHTSAVVQVALENLVPSVTNRDHDAKAIAELTESIRLKGVLQPIIARPFKGGNGNGSLEIVCGEARWKAATQLKLQTIPAIVRNYNDEEAQAAQIIENLQRSNPGALDEARAYENLRKLMGKAATIEAIAAQVGKDAPYVAQRLKLLDLVEPARKALNEGLIGIGHALEIAPRQEKQQLACIKWLGYDEHLAGNWGPSVKSVHSVRALRSFIQQNFMLTLINAPFDTADAKLLPKMGACLSCPHNTANASNLFPDLKEAVCMLPDCFFTKRDLALNAKIAEIEKKGGKLYRLGMGRGNDGAAKVKVDGYLAVDSWDTGPRVVRSGDECKSTKTAVLVYRGADASKEIKAEVGDTTAICTNHDCEKHGKRGGTRSGATGRVALKGMAFVNHKDGNLKKSLPERLRFAIFKELAAVFLEMKGPVSGQGREANWTDRIDQLAVWGFEQIGHDQKRDAVKALDLWPKEKKASEMDWDAVLRSYFKGKPWAFAMGVLAMQDIRNPYHERGEASKRYPGEKEHPEHSIFYLAKSFKVDVGKIADELKAADKAIVAKMTENAKAREEAKAKVKPAKTVKAKVKGPNVGKSGAKAKPAKKAKKAK